MLLYLPLKKQRTACEMLSGHLSDGRAAAAAAAACCSTGKKYKMSQALNNDSKQGVVKKEGDDV